VARRPDSTLRRRLTALRVNIGRGAPLTPPPGPTARSARSPPPPHQGFLDTGASRAPHGYRHRHNVILLLRAGAKTKQDCAKGQTPHWQSYAERALVTRKILTVPCRSGPIPFLAIPAARFFLRELHSVVCEKWGGLVRLTPQLRRDIQWWTEVPSQSNGKPIHKPIETTYLHTDSSGYGWGAVLNEHVEARGFWSKEDEQQHITWKELKAVR
jgi:hypothetical protein